MNRRTFFKSIGVALSASVLPEYNASATSYIPTVRNHIYKAALRCVSPTYLARVQERGHTLDLYLVHSGLGVNNCCVYCGKHLNHPYYTDMVHSDVVLNNALHEQHLSHPPILFFDETPDVVRGHSAERFNDQIVATEGFRVVLFDYPFTLDVLPDGTIAV